MTKIAKKSLYQKFKSAAVDYRRGALHALTNGYAVEKMVNIAGPLLPAINGAALVFVIENGGFFSDLDLTMEEIIFSAGSALGLAL